MTRIVLPLLILGTMACNPPEAKDGQTVWFDLMAVEGGGAVGGLEMTIGVDAEARQLGNNLDIHLSAIHTDETANLRLTMEMMDGTGRASMSDGTADFDTTPNFAACQASGMVEREDGGCDYSAQLLVLAERTYSLFVNVKLKTQAPDDWTGDPDLLNVYVDASAMEPEQQ